MTDLNELRLRKALLEMPRTKEGVDAALPELIAVRFEHFGSALREMVRVRHIAAIQSGIRRSEAIFMSPAQSKVKRYGLSLAIAAAAAILILIASTTWPTRQGSYIVVRSPVVEKDQERPGQKRDDKATNDFPSIDPPSKTSLGPDQVDRIVRREATTVRPLASTRKSGSFAIVSGEVRTLLPASGTQILARSGTPLQEGSRVQTGDMDRAELALVDGSTVRMSFNTEIELLAPGKGIRLHSGRVWLIVKQRDKDLFVVRAPTASATVLGTEFGVGAKRIEVAGQTRWITDLAVKSGRVQFANVFGSVIAGEQTESVAFESQPPSVPKRIQVLREIDLRPGRAVLEQTTKLTESDAVYRLAWQCGDHGLYFVRAVDGLVRIYRVSHGTPADIAGFRVGDIVQTVDGNPAPEPLRLRVLLCSAPGRKFEFKLTRRGETIILSIVPALRQFGPSTSEFAWSGRLTSFSSQMILGDRSEIRSGLEALARERKHSTIYNNLGVLCELEDDVGSAIRWYQRANEIDPDVELYRFNLGMALRKIGNLDRSLEELRRALELDPADPSLYAELATGHRIISETDAADEVLDEGAREIPGATLLWLRKAVHEASTQRPELARTSIEVALRLEPDNPDAWGLKGAILSDLGEFAGAEAALRKSIDLNPAGASAHLNLANLYASRGDQVQAEKLYRRVTELEPTAPDGFNNWGNALSKLGRLEEALSAYQRSVELAPNVIGLRTNLALHFRNMSRLNEARLEFESASKLGPLNAGIYNAWAGVLMDLGRRQEAEEKWRLAIRLRPDSPVLQYNLGVLMGQIGRSREAEVLYREAIRLEPKFWNAYENLASQLAGEKKVGSSEDVWRNYVRASNGRPEALNGLAWHLAEFGIKLDEALDYARRAVERMPKNPGMMDTLGWVHYKRREYELAEQSFKQAIDLYGQNPASAETWIHLGRVYEATFDMPKARNAYQRALVLDTDNEAAASGLKRTGG